jgi:phosphoribosylglycinamide formyltransferase-1
MKTAVFISGRGSNLQALVDGCADGTIPASIALFVSNRPGAPGLARAEAAGSPTAVFDHKDYGKREDFDAVLDSTVRDAGCTFICLAGFMRILTDGFVRGWRDRMINIHPSLLPAFPGLNCHARAIEAGVRITGATVHFNRPELDAGPIIVQGAVPVLPGDDEDALAARILKVEHKIYPMALKLIAEGRISVRKEVVYIKDAAFAQGAMLNPKIG